MTFGAFIKDSRVKKGLTLREFCRLMKWDASNWSKVERGVLPPPRSPKVLKMIANALGFAESSEDWYALIDLAAISFIPTSLMNDRTIIEKLPIFFRTLRGEKPSREDLEALIDKVRKG